MCVLSLLLVLDNWIRTISTIKLKPLLLIFKAICQCNEPCEELDHDVHTIYNHANLISCCALKKEKILYATFGEGLVGRVLMDICLFKLWLLEWFLMA